MRIVADKSALFVKALNGLMRVSSPALTGSRCGGVGRRCGDHGGDGDRGNQAARARDGADDSVVRSGHFHRVQTVAVALRRRRYVVQVHARRQNVERAYCTCLLELDGDGDDKNDMGDEGESACEPAAARQCDVVLIVHQARRRRARREGAAVRV